MALLPDFGRKLIFEKNVDIPAGLKTGSAYDLTLYPELGNPTRGVLTVTVIGNFSFKDGKKADGSKLGWTEAEKTNFKLGFRNAVTAMWDDKHRITTASTAPFMKSVGVLFYIWTRESMSVFDHSHWNIGVTKTDRMIVSTVNGSGGSFATNGGANLDSEDLTGVNKGAASTQRGAVHEFGHMMGFRDEYADGKGVAEDNPNWLGDTGSVMNRGETVRDRHYVFFADWLTKQFKAFANAKGTRIDWKVNGTVDLSNARL